jgi:hypothetical protein
VEIVRRWLHSPKATREEVRASAAESWDADGDYYPVGKFPEARHCHGLEDISEFVGGIVEAWSDLAFGDASCARRARKPSKR